MPPSVVERGCKKMYDKILKGVYLPGERLPAERDLATQLNISRVSVREVLKRLSEAGVLITYRGSGAVIQPRHAWNLSALSHIVRFGLAQKEWEALAEIFRDAFFLRHTLVVEFLIQAARQPHIDDLTPAREKVHEAWKRRRYLPQFFETDREIIPLALEAARMYPSLWILNSAAQAYLAVVELLQQGFEVPEIFVDAHMRILDGIEQRQPDAVGEEIRNYLAVLDRSFLNALPAELRNALIQR